MRRNPSLKKQPRSIEKLVVDSQYHFEQHMYQTKDDYLNFLHRVNFNDGKSKPVVFYQHGLLDSSAGACCNGTHSLAFFLASCGFDVWLNNARGNRYSRGHQFKNADENEEYWKFSFEDVVTNDFPAAIEFVLGHCGTKSLSFIGHGQGTTILLAALSNRMDYYKHRINVAILMAPMTTMH